MKFMSKVNVAFALLGGYALLFLSVMIVVEVLGRKFFGFSLQGVDEVGGYVVAITGTFGFAYALIERTHTRIDVFLEHVPSRGRYLLNILAYVCVAGTAIFMTFHAYEAVRVSFDFGSRSTTPLQTPVWVPQLLWLAGLVLFALTSIAVLVHLLATHFRDPEKGYARYGPQTLQEELHREVAEVKIRTSARESENEKGESRW